MLKKTLILGIILILSISSCLLFLLLGLFSVIQWTAAGPLATASIGIPGLIIAVYEKLKEKDENHVHIEKLVKNVTKGIMYIDMFTIAGISLLIFFTVIFPFFALGGTPMVTPTPTPTISPTLGPSSTPYPLLSSGQVISRENAAMVDQIGSLQSDYVSQAIWSPDGNWLAISPSIEMYDVETMELIHTIDASIVRDIVFSTDSSFLLAVGQFGIEAWNVDGWGQRVVKSEAGNFGRGSVAFSPDGKTMVTGHEKAVQLWDTTSWEVIQTLPSDEAGVLAFSPDGKTIAAGDAWEIEIWDVESGQKIQVLDGDFFSVRTLAFSPDSKILASGSSRKDILFWDCNSGLQSLVLVGHDSGLKDVAFSPDGQVLASVSDDGTLRLWDTNSGNELNKLVGHTDQIHSVAFSPDGAFLATAGSSQGVLFWGLP